MSLLTQHQYLLYQRTSQPLQADVETGAESYKRRLGRYPNLCLVSVGEGAAVAEAGSVKATGARRVQIRVDSGVRPGQMCFLEVRR